MKKLLVIKLVFALSVLSINASIRPTSKATFTDVSTSEANSQITSNTQNENFVILDVREKTEYDEGHIKNAFNLDFNSATFDTELDKLDKTKTYLVYCRSGNRSSQASDKMQTKNFTTVHNMLGGFNQWIADNLAQASPTSIVGEDVSTAVGKAMIAQHDLDDNFVLLDVRTPTEFQEEHIKGAANLDFNASTFDTDLAALDKNKQYLVYCRTGNRSRQAVDKMMAQNFIESYNMLGGITQWKADGYPTETPTVEYCTASANDGPEHISNVVFGTISNSSARDNYMDYTSISTNVTKGSSYDLTVTIGSIYSGDKATAWVDWNVDGDFVDSDEKFALSVSGSTATASITVPAGAKTASTRMRIRVYYNSSSDDPCGAKSYGEVEDYTLNVADGGNNTPPSVSITSPADNATFETGNDITINATATDTEGSVTSVEFYNGTSLLGTDNSSPYSHVISSATAGSYTLTAKATDNEGASATSSVVNITVNNPGNEAPTVSITSPVNNSTIAPGSLTLSATAADSDGTIANVEFFNSSTSLGTDNTSPYSYTIPSLGIGTYTFTAKATDDDGATTTSDPVNVTVADVTYCDASANDGPEYISNVEFGTISNSSARNNYMDYTSISTDVSKGSSYPLTVTIGSIYNGDKATAWVDWNGDKDFADSDEKFALTVSGSTATGNIVVPATASTISTRMRIRLYYNAASDDPCGAKAYGEVEDYTVNIGDGSGPELTTIEVTPSTASVAAGESQQFSAQGKDQNGNNMTVTITWSATGGTIDNSGLFTAGSTAGSYTVTASSGSVSGTASVSVTVEPPVLTSIEVSPSSPSISINGTQQFTAQGKDQNGNNMTVNVDWTTTGGSIDPSGLFTGSEAGTFTVTATSGTIQGTASITVNGITTYCEAGANNGPEYISNVVFNTISNSSNRGSSGYEDHTSISTTVNKGSSYNLNVTIGSLYNGDKATAWFDWNGDGDFEDTGEKFALNISGSSATSSIAVPTAATASSTRMRIRVYYYDAEDKPCGTESSSYGEVEDYTINLEGAPASFLTNTELVESPESDIKVFPNPVSHGELTVETSFNSFTVKLIDLTGKTLLVKECNNSVEKLSLPEINGLYILVVQTDNNIITKEIIIK